MKSRYSRAAGSGLALCLLNACSAPSAPCPSLLKPDLRGNAGCVIVNDHRLLTVTHRFTRTLDLPGGTAKSAESAACTAWRESYEELGIEVVVDSYLATLNNGFILFRCTAQRPIIATGGDGLEIRSVDWREPESIEQNDWRYPAQWPQIADLIQAQH